MRAVAFVFAVAFAGIGACDDGRHHHGRHGSFDDDDTISGGATATPAPANDASTDDANVTTDPNARTSAQPTVGAPDAGDDAEPGDAASDDAGDN